MTTETPTTELTIDAILARLPLVEQITRDLCSGWSDVIEKRNLLEDLHHYRGRESVGAPELDDELRTELNRGIERINGYLKEIQELGGSVSDFRRGLVTFPATFEERLVVASWQPGDTTPLHYHELYERVEDRRPLGCPA